MRRTRGGQGDGLGRRAREGTSLELTPNAITVLEKRYLAKENGTPIETPEDMFRRVAKNIAEVDRDRYGRTAKATEKLAAEFYEMMTSLDFLPNSPTLMNAGRELQQLAACFVLPIEDSMNSIFDSLKYSALIHQSGGGTGFSFSRLRPKNDQVRSTGGVASGPISFLKVYNAATEAVKQGGCVAPDTLVSTDRGLVPISELGPVDAAADSWHGHAEPLTVATDDGPRPSDEFYNHGVSKVRTVRTRNGYHVTATPEHRLRIINEDGHYVWRHVGDLKTGDWVVLQKGHLVEPADRRLPVLAQRPHFKAKPVKLPGEASECLGEFVGYFIGDGSLNWCNTGKKTGRLIMTVCDRPADVREWLMGTGAELFGLTPTVNKKPDEGSANFFYCSTTLVNWLQGLGVDKPSAASARVPTVAFRMGAAFARGFLRGLFTADGTVSDEGYPSLSSVSGRLIDDVQQLLLAVGIPSRRSVVERRQGAFGPMALHRLRVITHAGLERFATEIGFIDEARGEQLKARLDKDYETNDIIPNQEKALAVAYAGAAPRHLTRSRFQQLADKHAAIRDSELAQFLGSDQFYDQVAAIEEGESLTLDLSVPANNTYIANGFVSHNTRRGANMGILRVDHPDIMEFITCKQNNTDIANFNISVAVTDAFMKAVEADAEYDLINPRNKKVTGQLKAREVFDLIIQMAWKNGEPGIIFLDEMNRHNPTPALGEIESTNPCGEQPLLPFEACNLGSINLAHMAKKAADGKVEVDWERLGKLTRKAVHFLDNVIDASLYPLERIDEMVKGNRKVGLGVMGFADLLIELGIPYDAPEAAAMAEKLMAFIRSEARVASNELAVERGSFPNFDKSVFAGGRPTRNATTTTIAPTGTISIIAGCSSGIEPLFALAFVRNVLDNNRLVELNPLFEQVAKEWGFYSKEIMEEVATRGTCRGVAGVPEDVQRVFATAHDVSGEAHIAIQAAFQRGTDNAVSKTVNLPHDASVEDVSAIYWLAYHQGCKGVTIYRDGSRDMQVLSVPAREAKAGKGNAPGESGGEEIDKAAGTAEVTAAATAVAASSATASARAEADGAQAYPTIRLRPRPRPEETTGITRKYRIGGCGKLFVTVNSDEDGICEVFINTGEEGCSPFSEALGRMISVALRAGMDPEEVIEQVRGIKCVGCIVDPETKVLSCPDAIAKAIEKHLQGYNRFELKNLSTPKGVLICPEKGCGGIMVHEGGCYHCLKCGYSKCG